MLDYRELRRPSKGKDISLSEACFSDLEEWANSVADQSGMKTVRLKDLSYYHKRANEITDARFKSVEDRIDRLERLADSGGLSLADARRLAEELRMNQRLQAATDDITTVQERIAAGMTQRLQSTNEEIAKLQTQLATSAMTQLLQANNDSAAVQARIAAMTQANLNRRR